LRPGLPFDFDSRERSPLLLACFNDLLGKCFCNKINLRTDASSQLEVTPEALVINTCESFKMSRVRRDI